MPQTTAAAYAEAAIQHYHQATIMAIAFLFALVADERLLAELVESLEQCRPRAQA